eukprot:g8620.t1
MYCFLPLKIELAQALAGSIPPELGNLGALQNLFLYDNQLSGPIPAELGQLATLQVLNLEGNELTGHIPRELQVALSKLQGLGLSGNKLIGGPRQNESLQAWRTRLKSELVEQERAKQDRAEQSRAEEHARLEHVVPNAALTGHTSSSQGGGGDPEDLSRVHLESFAGLHGIIRENHEALEQMKRLIEKPAASSFPPGTELTETAKLRELDRLVAMAKALGEVASRHMEDKATQQEELALPPGSKAYSTFVRTGLSNAYLAASVVDSGLVRTSKTGGMSKAGEALKLLSGAVPVVGGLAGFAAAALQAGDHHMQTRRVVKITDMEVDTVECCWLARRLALRLTDGLAAGIISTNENKGEILQRNTVAVGDGAGECGRDLAMSALPDGESEEAVMEWFVGEVANLEASDGRRGTSEEQNGKRLGKRHLRTLLVAVGRGCLEGTNTAGEKVEKLLKVIVPEASIRPVKPAVPRGNLFVRSPVPAPSHDGSLDREAEFAAMKAKIEALELAEERRRADFEALQSDNRRLRGEMEAVKKG